MIKDIIAIWRVFLYIVLTAMALVVLNRVDEKTGKDGCAIEKSR